MEEGGFNVKFLHLERIRINMKIFFVLKCPLSFVDYNNSVESKSGKAESSTLGPGLGQGFYRLNCIWNQIWLL
jgi:hypothetical protein